jgi:hypothetical protein
MATFDAQEFMGVAVRVASSEPNEAGYRTAISRAYYACHLVGCNATEEKGWFPHRTHTGADHSGLWREALKTYPWRHKLRDLLELREHADYHTDSLPLKDTCRYCGEATQTQVLVNCETWERAKLIAQDILPRLKNIAPQAK